MHYTVIYVMLSLYDLQHTNYIILSKYVVRSKCENFCGDSKSGKFLLLDGENIKN